jgi:hypothetical protein
MFDNHTFASLPLDPDAAAEKVRQILARPDGSGRCGMLCSHQFKEYVHHDYRDLAGDEKFINATRDWVRRAVAYQERLEMPESA